MHHERLASELLRCLRGSRSQVALSRRLGYRANVAYVWEGGRRYPAAHVLFRLAVLDGVSADAIAAFAAPAAMAAVRGRPWDRRDTAALLRGLAAQSPVVDIARAVGVNRTTVARWLKAVTEPRVPQLLAFIDAMTHRLVEFVALFADPAKLPSIRALARDLDAQRRLAYERPWSHAVLRALELDAYRVAPGHPDETIARAIGLPAADEQELVRELARTRQIRKRAGKWMLGRVLTVDTRSDPQANRRLKEHWAAVGLERLRSGRVAADALFSYNLFAASRRDVARLRELHVEYFERVRRIVAESDRAERVVLLNVQLVPLEIV